MSLIIKNYLRELTLFKNQNSICLFSFVLFFILISLKTPAFTQEKVVIKANNVTLNTVITTLRDNYALKVSFNDDKLSKYTINLEKSFTNAEDALNYLIKDLPLKLDFVNNVFIISNIKTNSNTKYLVSGNIIDAISNETLPSSTVIINGLTLTSDQRGNFSYTSNTDSIFRLQVSYLGYLKLDTLIKANNYLNIRLHQSTIKIAEVVLSSIQSNIESNTFFNTGSLKINHNISENLPGSSDNSVYNLLRLQPGILASGEQSNDLLVWGSYKGQTKISFDGFTIFGVRNFNDNIGAVNPLIAKDLNVLKGGYGVTNGDRVGGVIDIIGVEGNSQQPKIKIGINNLTLNGFVSTPLFKNTALVIAARQTYYNVYNPYSLNTNNRNNDRLNNIVDLTVTPDYVFNDINLKFSGKSDKCENYHLSLFNGTDKLSSAYNTTKGRLKINGAENELNKQFGGSAYYSKIWKKGAISSITMATSGLNYTEDDEVKLNFSNNNQNFNNIADLVNNNISETSVKFSHRLPTTKDYNVIMGTGYIYNQTTLTKDSLNFRQLDEKNYSSRFYGYSEINYFINQKLKFTPGLRVDIDLTLQKTYLQPRFATKYQINKALAVSASWGIYKQFIAYNATIDEQGDLKYTWTVSDGKKIPVYSAQHWVIGTNFEKNNWWINTDFYYKTTTGITRFVQLNNRRENILGNGRAIGVDILVKKNYKRNTAWVAYTLSKTTENYPIKVRNSIVNQYKRAPQDQRHEIKFAGILNVKSFYLSANYVYGSGFPSTNPFDNPSTNLTSYKRFDTALTYKFSAKKYRLETGLSILNLFNTQNLKTGNLERIPTEQASTINIYSQSVPFTPTLFLNFSL